MRWRVPLHSPNRVPVVRVVALSVDIKQYIHIFREGILRRVHVGVSQSWVMCLGMLAVNDRVMVGHPAGLLRAYFHRFFVCLFVCFNKRSYTHQKFKKVQTPPLFNPQVRFFLLPITWNWTRQFVFTKSVRSFVFFLSLANCQKHVNWTRPFNKRALTCESQMHLY